MKKILIAASILGASTLGAHAADYVIAGWNFSDNTWGNGTSAQSTDPDSLSYVADMGLQGNGLKGDFSAVMLRNGTAGSTNFLEGLQYTHAYVSAGTTTGNTWLTGYYEFEGNASLDGSGSYALQNRAASGSSTVNGSSVVWRFGTQYAGYGTELAAGYFTDIKVQFASILNGANGFDNSTWGVSTDGMNYTTIASNWSPMLGTWTTSLFDLSAMESIENQSDVYLKLTVDGAPGTYLGLNDRITLDNMQIVGSYNISPVPEPSSAALLMGGAALLGVCARRRRALV